MMRTCDDLVSCQNVDNDEESLVRMSVCQNYALNVMLAERWNSSIVLNFCLLQDKLLDCGLPFFGDVGVP